LVELPYREFLFTVAEVSAAFVGFSLLVSILKPAEDAVRFFSMRDVATISLIAVAGSLIPYVLFQFGIRGDPLWRASSGGLSLGWLIGLAFSMRRFVALGSPPWRTPALAAVGGLINLGANGSLWWSVFAGGSLSGPRYILALLLLLSIAGVLFIWAAFQSASNPPAA
jgi:hypothetical protein